MIRVKVPASSANMGAGFDTLGTAVALYSRIEVTETNSGLEIITKHPSGFIPQGENNLIYRAMKTVFDNVGYRPRGLRIVQDSDIPMTRGLGSSSGCIAGGMLAANIMAGRQLSYPEILDLAAAMEGHPDNVAPAIYGGMCISLTHEGHTVTRSIKLDPKLKFAVMIPDFYVQTKRSRGVLPDMIPREDASFNIQRAAMLVYAMEHCDTELLRCAVEDRLHQPYRKCYIDGFDEIIKKSYENGACAAYLSGSGPTIVSILDRDYDAFAQRMQDYFKENGGGWVCMILDADNVGSVVSYPIDKKINNNK